MSKTKYKVWRPNMKEEIVEGDSHTVEGAIAGQRTLKIRRGNKIEVFKPGEWAGATDTTEKDPHQ